LNLPNLKELIHVKDDNAHTYKSIIFLF